MMKKVYVVMGGEGYYSDRDVWAVAVLPSEEQAQAFCDGAEQEAKRVEVEHAPIMAKWQQLHPADIPFNSSPDEWTARGLAVGEWRDGLDAELNTVAANRFDPQGTSSRVSYSFEEVPWIEEIPDAN